MESEINATQVGKIQGRFLEANRREARRDNVKEGPNHQGFFRDTSPAFSHSLFVLKPSGQATRSALKIRDKPSGYPGGCSVLPHPSFSHYLDK